MAYSAPSIGPAGLTIPTYQDIRDWFVSNAQLIYGQSEYLGIDSGLYQLLSLIALNASDVAQFGQLVYNARSPLLAIGSSLDPLGIICGGVTRSPGSSSTALVTLSGVAGTTVSNAALLDQNGNQWNLPATVTIGGGGTVSVTATANDIGAIAAPPNTINIIKAGATAGWISVTNAGAATPGTNIESDSSFRARMIISQSLPGRTMLASTIAAIEAVAGVTRLNVLENPTGSVDIYGTPAHSITAVVEGGTNLDVATAIFNYKGVGAFTNGTIPIVVIDPNTGDVTTINFDRPSNVPIWATVSVHPLLGFQSAMQAQIQANIVSYLNSLQIGQEVTIASLYYVAQSAMPNIVTPAFSITALVAGTSSGGQSTSDIILNYNQVAQGVGANVAINLV